MFAKDLKAGMTIVAVAATYEARFYGSDRTETKSDPIVTGKHAIAKQATITKVHQTHASNIVLDTDQGTVKLRYYAEVTTR